MTQLNKPIYTLGYSGLDGYLSFKKKYINDLSESEALVSQGMDSAAALMKNGTIVAACAEERFTGKKHTGDFPKNAIEYCLRAADISMQDVDYIAHNFDYAPYESLLNLNDYSRELFDKVLSDGSQISLFKKYFGANIKNKFRACAHHDAHAAYAFETSGFQTSLVAVADGIGEYSSISIYQASQEIGLQLIRTYGPESSLGMLYSAVTDYLGFVTNSDEYKIMGLAAYGDPNVFKELFDEIVIMDEKGEITINELLPITIKKPQDRETYRHFKNWLSERIFPERDSSQPIEKKHKDLAAALQCKLNEAVLHLIKYWQKECKSENLCYAGGVALNCVANAYISERQLFKQIYIAPAAADDGTALGAALIMMRQAGHRLDSTHYLDMPFYGPEITLNKDSEIIKSHRLSVNEVDNKELIRYVCDAIIDGKIVAWAQGAMEFGPRALGHRSILADPRKYEMRERLNKVTKQRENFRPFAPIVKQESIDNYFTVVNGVVYKHMLVNSTVKKDHLSELEAITHIDGTARVQSVSKKELPLIWGLLDRFEKLTSLPVLLNTSFNLKSMPIVCDDNDALRAFVDSDIDILVINNAIITKLKGQSQ